MKPLLPYFLAVSFLLIVLQESVEMEECIFRKLDMEDKMFCRGSLEIFYPELGDVGCTYIPKCNAYRKRISKEWISPEVRYQQADMDSAQMIEPFEKREEAKEQRLTRAANKRLEEQRIQQHQLFDTRAEAMGGARPKKKDREDFRAVIQKLQSAKSGNLEG